MDYPKNEQIPLKRIYTKKEFLALVKQGLKTAEVRLSNEVTDLKVGEEFELSSYTESIKVRVTSIETYKSIEYLSTQANLDSIVPGITKDQAVQKWRKLYPNYSGSISIINFELVKNDNIGN